MPAPTRKTEWLPYAGLFLAIAGIIYQGGALTNQVEQQESRIVKLEAAQAALNASLQEMNIRGVKNESKLDFLVTQAQAQAQESGQKGRR